MAAEQDNKELSMAEILASIKKILADNEMTDTKSFADNTKKMPEISFPTYEQTKTENVSAANEDRLASPKAFSIIEKNASSEQGYIKNPYVTLENAEPTLMPQAQNEEAKENNVSDEIISSFTRMFEQNDFRRHTEQPQFDADALLRQIINQAVAEKLNNKFLQNTIKETIVPVLEEWLSHYLPKLVAEEVERVMVKTGRR